ncbi:MAG: hypothetical protein PHV97_07135 [Candidatus Omnitrophica bacterium]|nr:hypothetical protein [Candidatus Omnitrophota bacterium]
MTRHVFQSTLFLEAGRRSEIKPEGVLEWPQGSVVGLQALGKAEDEQISAFGFE